MAASTVVLAPHVSSLPTPFQVTHLPAASAPLRPSFPQNWFLPHLHRSATSPSGLNSRAVISSETQADHFSKTEGQPNLTTPFHLAIPVHNVQAARDFYGEILGCPEGRSAKTWVDFNLYGHQLVCHCVPNYNAESSANPVDGDPVPVPHFGLAMTVSDFIQLAERVKAKGIQFIIEPHIRFKGQPGEQWTMFFKDRSGNSLEFKAMTNPRNLFAKYVVEE